MSLQLIDVKLKGFVLFCFVSEAFIATALPCLCQYTSAGLSMNGTGLRLN